MKPSVTEDSKKEADMDRYTEKEAFCFLQITAGCTTAQLRTLSDYFGAYAAALAAPAGELTSAVGKEAALKILSALECSPVEADFARLKKEGIAVTFPGDGVYPKRLTGLREAPASLYYIGELPADDVPSVAIVGARNCSGYGRQMAREFGREIGGEGIQVISGMAAGIDGIAQRGALAVKGKSYGVLGCGVDRCYPAANRDLYEELRQKGGVISEYVPGTEPKACLFPSRNRIISGLADAVLVLEAREKSGTLITVSMALEQGRDVYALPGRVSDSLSEGCNRLIYEGATPLIRPYEFVEEFYRRYRGVKGINNAQHAAHNKLIVPKEELDNRFLSANERLVLSVLDYTPKSAGEIFFDINGRSDLRIEELLQLLTSMTVRHMIECIDGCMYGINSRR